MFAKEFLSPQNLIGMDKRSVVCLMNRLVQMFFLWCNLEVINKLKAHFLINLFLKAT